MKKLIPISVILVTLFTLVSCVESSQKYKDLQSRLDSLSVVKDSTSAQLEDVFATLNEVENGLRSIREAENIIALQSQNNGELTVTTREQMKQDVTAIGEAIAAYKAQVAKLRNDNRIQSAQFRKRLDAMTAELEQKSVLIADLQKQLEEKDTQLRIKSQQIATLDQTVSNLRGDVASLSQEKELHKETIATQDQLINTAFYIAGSKDELINAKVLSKGGLFRSARISYEAEQSAFVKIDIRKVNEINLNAAKAKILSIHPTGTYTMETDANGMQVLKISSPQSFWEQTKYLVIQVM
jgi:chromosome segregation ATPase